MDPAPKPFASPPDPDRKNALRVCVIEGDAVFANEIAAALDARGMQARAFHEGYPALDEIPTARPDLILLCAELPDVSGYVVCSRLKRNKRTASIPVIFTSARADAGIFDAHRRLWVRADAYLRKPFDAAALAKIVAKLLALPSEARVSASTLTPPPACARANPPARKTPPPPTPPAPAAASAGVLEDGFELVGEAASPGRRARDAERRRAQQVARTTPRPTPPAPSGPSTPAPSRPALTPPPIPPARTPPPIPPAAVGFAVTPPVGFAVTPPVGFAVAPAPEPERRLETAARISPGRWKLPGGLGSVA